MYFSKSLVALTLFSSCLLQGCLRSQGPNISLTLNPSEDSDYLAVYKTYTQREHVYKNFETKFTVSVTMLTSEFRRALAKRHDLVMSQKQDYLADFTNKTGFFISVFSPSSDNLQLDDENYWTISLQKGSETHKPITINSLSPKKKWELFFPDISNWSKEYLVIFDVSTPIGSDHQMVAKEPISLNLNNIEGKIRINY